MLKIIFFGDICGEAGRKAVKQNLPGILESEKPDLVLANVDNLAHGKGITTKTLEELIRAGIQGFTSGNHGFSKRALSDEAFEKYKNLIARPYNIPDTYPGQSAVKIETKKGIVLLGHFLGQVFMEKQFHDPIESPFDKFQAWLQQNKTDDVVATFVDLHAEVTSEKVAFGHFIDGKVSVLVGTHTHVPTADYKLLPNGTAYITDVGMCGPADSVLGMKKEISLERFVNKAHVPYDVPEDASHAELSYVIIDVDENTGKALNIKGIHQVVEI
ncbi:MAG TPA: TIGR00282 family metallophosphoesterase [Candidatus Binatia bacterium]|nr:TIGR00282 family metallophosphoesterase [Candidatus Binatia bacterium]